MPAKKRVLETVVESADDHGTGSYLNSDEVNIFGDDDFEEKSPGLLKHESNKIKLSDHYIGEKIEEEEGVEEYESDIDDEVEDSDIDDEEVDEKSEEDDEEDEEESEEEPEEEPDEESDEVEDSTTTVDIAEDEYDYLKNLSKDELIAKMVNHRKSHKTMQSVRSKIDNALTKEVTDSIISGETDPRVVRKLMHDLTNSQQFQEYVSDFYTKYEYKDGTYHKIDDTPDVSILQKYNDLVIKKVSLDINELMPEGLQYDPSEAFMPGTASNKAYQKYQAESQKIDKEISAIMESASNNVNGREEALRKQRDASEKRMKELFNADSKLKGNLSAQDDFRQFVQSNGNDLVGMFLKAWKFEKASKTKVKTLVLNEKKSISKNKKRPKAGSKKVSTNKVNTKRFIEDDIFGDL